jgi:ribosome-associated heat shock protein Hsp15
MSAAGDSPRLDKFLWAARFFKTRSLASEAISTGRVTLNEQRCKPSRNVQVGDRLWLRQGDEEKTLIVRALSTQRGPATRAAWLYEETPDSIALREQQRERRALDAASRPHTEGRPSKRQRRQIIRFKNQQ